ncbi:MAG: RNA methyltransferase [Balneolaceae bacterium]|jgi:tRNA (guanosine-2'-O-)-methyltransferase
MDESRKAKLINYLCGFVTEERWQKINEVLEKRTRYLTVVLEDIYQPHNASAVLRSCDCFGIQDVHIIENKNDFNPTKGVTIGADQWISMKSYNDAGRNNTQQCYNRLKEEGYKIVATSPHKEDVTIDEVLLDQKTALVFGAEYTGLSDYALKEADEYAKIPMVGFSESFNISVGAAICLYELSTKLRKSNKLWGLDKDEKLQLQYNWLRNSIRAVDKVEKRFLRDFRNTEQKK